MLERISSYSNLLNEIFLIVYLLIVIDAILLGIGANNSVHTINNWEFSYFLSNLLIAVIASIGIIFMLKNIESFLYDVFFTVFFAIWAVIELISLLLFGGEFIFRMSLVVLVTILLYYKVRKTRLDIAGMGE